MAPAKQIDPVDVIVKLLKTTDGRDKLYKWAASMAKVLSDTQSNPELAKRMAALAKTIGDARSIMRMAKWIQKYNEICKEVALLKSEGCNTMRTYARIVRIANDTGYIIGDNLQWMGKYQLVTLDHKAMAKRSKVFQFWGYIIACCLHLYDLLLHAGKTGTFTDAGGKKLIQNFIRDTCDATCALPSVGYIPSFKPSATTTGTLGLISASIATSQNWKANC